MNHSSNDIQELTGQFTTFADIDLPMIVHVIVYDSKTVSVVEESKQSMITQNLSYHKYSHQLATDIYFPDIECSSYCASIKIV